MKLEVTRVSHAQYHFVSVLFERMDSLPHVRTVSYYFINKRAQNSSRDLFRCDHPSA